MKILKSKKLLTALMALVFIFTISAMGLYFASKAYADDDSIPFNGKGSELEPYEIADADDFIKLSQLSTWEIPSSAYFILTADIDLSGYTDWTPIGNNYMKQQEWFSSKLDGKGHVIKNFNIDIDYSLGSGSQAFFGLFGILSGNAEIKNLGIESGHINLVNGDSYSEGMVGSLAGENQGTIINCYSNISINCNSHAMSGGLVGKNSGSGIIENSYNTGEINADRSYAPAGGIAGKNEGTITNCYNKGDILAYKETGGIAGNNSGTIENCYNTGDIVMNLSYTIVGGIAAINEGTIDYCYNTGNISASSSGNIVGGIAGESSNRVSNCYNIGEIMGDIYVGGIVGSNYGEVFTCYSIGNIFGNQYVGGIVGETESGALYNCMALGEKVVGNTYIGRVSGSGNARSYNNYAFSEMSDGNSGTWGDRRHYTKDGADILAKEIIQSRTLGGFFLENLGWATQSGKLPGLFGEVVDMPLYIILACSYAVEIQDWTYGDTQSNITIINPSRMTIQIYYRIEGEESWISVDCNEPLSELMEISFTDKLNVGLYDIKVIFDGIYTATDTFKISKAQIDVSTEFTDNFVYDTSEKTLNISESEKYTISGNKATNAGSYKATLKLQDTINYEWKNGNSDDLTINWSIEKAQAVEPDTLPNLTAKVGQTLADISLDSKYSWKDSGTSVGEKGTRTFDAVYNPDPANYNSVDVKLTVTVAQVVEGIIFVQSGTYAYTYGQVLTNDLLAGEKATRAGGEEVEGTFTFKTANVKPNAETVKVAIIFTPNDGSDAVEFELSITVAKAQAVAPTTLPSGFEAKVGDKLSGISLADYAGFKWENPNFEFDKSGEIKVWVIYNPDSSNYNDARVEITIKVIDQPSSPGLNPTQIGLMVGAIALVVLGAILMIVFIARRRRQKQG